MLTPTTLSIAADHKPVEPQSSLTDNQSIETTRKEDMKSFLVIAGGLILAVVLILALSMVGLGFDRFVQPFAKETERRTYQNSIARQQGAKNGIGQDCANMESNTGAQKLAFARFVLTDSAAYSGNQGLSLEAERCVAEAKTAIATAPQ
jgi:hypothetical protein